MVYSQEQDEPNLQFIETKQHGMCMVVLVCANM